MPLALPRGVKGLRRGGTVAQNEGVDCVVLAAFVFGGWSRLALAMMTFRRSACRLGSIGGGSPARAARCSVMACEIVSMLITFIMPTASMSGTPRAWSPATTTFCTRSSD